MCNRGGGGGAAAAAGGSDLIVSLPSEFGSQVRGGRKIAVGKRSIYRRDICIK